MLPQEQDNFSAPGYSVRVEANTFLTAPPGNCQTEYTYERIE